jgi:hypothetical protein
MFRWGGNLQTAPSSVDEGSVGHSLAASLVDSLRHLPHPLGLSFCDSASHSSGSGAVARPPSVGAEELSRVRSRSATRDPTGHRRDSESGPHFRYAISWAKTAAGYEGHLTRPEYPPWLVDDAASDDDAEGSDVDTEDEGEEDYGWVAVKPCPTPPLRARPGPQSCQACAVPLTFWGFRAEAEHHCAVCGTALCSLCSSYWTLLPHMGHHTPQRTCKGCHVNVTGNLRPRHLPSPPRHP